jgi:putative transposase
MDVTALDPTMVIITREPDGRWYLTFTIDTDAPARARHLDCRAARPRRR